MPPELIARLAEAAARPYQALGPFAYQWARNKLRWDPMFAALLELGVLPPGARVLDLGCGRSLLAAWLLAAERLAADGAWTAVPQPPRGLRFEGVELTARHADCGRRALAAWGERVHVRTGDLCAAPVDGAQVVTLLDAIHYLAHADQERLLDRLRRELPPDGVLLARVGDGGAGLRAHGSRLTDRLVLLAQARRWSPLSCRPLAAWIEALRSRGLAVTARPMSAGTPFANALLIARVPSPARRERAG
jgi:SAM-dependent methyltransferase